GRLLPLRAPAISTGTIPSDVSAGSGADSIRTVHPDGGGQQIRRPRNHRRDHYFGSNSLQLRVGKHSVSVSRSADLYLQRHERLRALRAGAVLVDYLLVCDLGVSRRDFDRARAARSRRLAGRAIPAGARTVSTTRTSPRFIPRA